MPHAKEFLSRKAIDKLPTEAERRAERQRKIDAYEKKVGPLPKDQVITDRDVDDALEIKDNMPFGGSLSPKGDLGDLRVREGEKAGNQFKRNGSAPKASSLLSYRIPKTAIDAAFGPGDTV